MAALLLHGILHSVFPVSTMRQTEGLHEGISRIASPMMSAARSSLWHRRFLALEYALILAAILLCLWPTNRLCDAQQSMVETCTRELPISTYRRSEGAAFEPEC
jgi:hypothetical protein